MDNIKISVTIDSSVEDVWEKWVNGDCIKQWYFASEDWHVPFVIQNFLPGENFVIRMEAKDKSMGFDFAGTYQDIQKYESVIYKLEDGRKVSTTFKKIDEGIELVQVFEVEDLLSADMQKQGWQAILYNFKKYVESTS